MSLFSLTKSAPIYKNSKYLIALHTCLNESSIRKTITAMRQYRLCIILNEISLRFTCGPMIIIMWSKVTIIIRCIQVNPRWVTPKTNTHADQNIHKKIIEINKTVSGSKQKIKSLRCIYYATRQYGETHIWTIHDVYSKTKILKQFNRIFKW